MIFSIITWVALFMFLVIIHELGHFFAAKKSGVKVLEFWVGIPPKICTLWTDKSGTEYTLNAIPLGGFVRLKGEDPTVTEDFHARDSFISANVVRKTIILLGWVTMNLLFAFFIFTLGFRLGVKPLFVVPENTFQSSVNSYLMPTLGFLEQKNFISGDIDKSQAQVFDILPDGLAAKVWLQSGDIITTINAQEVNNFTLGRQLKKLIGEKFLLTYKRWAQVLTATVQCPPDSCLLGVALAQSGSLDILPIKFDFKGAVKASLQEIKAQTILTFESLGSLGKNLLSFDGEKTKGALSKLSGPIGAIKVGDMVLNQYGRLEFFLFWGLISMALCLFNILPIPALDWGRLLGVYIQTLFRLKKEKYFIIENYINMVFFLVLMALWIYIMLKDLVVARWVQIPFMS